MWKLRATWLIERASAGLGWTRPSPTKMSDLSRNMPGGSEQNCTRASPSSNMPGGSEQERAHQVRAGTCRAVRARTCQASPSAFEQLSAEQVRARSNKYPLSKSEHVRASIRRAHSSPCMPSKTCVVPKGGGPLHVPSTQTCSQLLWTSECIAHHPTQGHYHGLQS